MIGKYRKILSGEGITFTGLKSTYRCWSLGLGTLRHPSPSESYPRNRDPCQEERRDPYATGTFPPKHGPVRTEDR